MGASTTTTSFSAGRLRRSSARSPASGNLAVAEGRDDTWALAKRQLWAGVRNRVRADVVSLTAAGSAGLRNRQWQSSLQLLGELRSSSLRADSHSKNVALSSMLYRRRGWIYSVQLLEDGMVADVVAYTTVMRARASASLWYQAVGTLTQMGERKLNINNMAFTIGLSACEEGRHWEVAMNLLERAVSAKVEADVRTLTAALSNFNWEVTSWIRALSLYHQSISTALEADVVLCCAAMSTCRDPWHWSLQCFGLLRQQRLQTNAVASATATKAFELSTHWAPALALLASLARDGCQPCALENPICSSARRATATAGCEGAATGLAACSACGQVSSWEHSLRIALSGAPARVASCARGTAWCLALFVAAVPERRREVARVSLNTAMSALGRIELWQTVAGMLSQMSRRQIVPDIISHNSVISAMLHAWEDALVILRLLGGCEGLVSFNATLRSMATAAQWPLALQLVLTMRRRARAIAGITWNSVLSACENDGQWPVALLLLHEMPELRVLLDLFGRNSAISASEKGSQWAVALHLLQASDHGVEADVLSFGSVVAGCRTPDLWHVAATTCHQMRAVQVRTDVVACSAALSALGNAAKWRQAAQVCANSEAMQEQDLPYNAAVWAFAQGERRAQQLSQQEER
ncbi:EMB2654 [Symbiodinium sp. CCMP2456]|nr:EMB2654 [Symbiodinium sp. CCMP2456]